jgi:hypothetical protein
MCVDLLTTLQEAPARPPHLHILYLIHWPLQYYSNPEELSHQHAELAGNILHTLVSKGSLAQRLAFCAQHCSNYTQLEDAAADTNGHIWPFYSYKRMKVKASRSANRENAVPVTLEEFEEMMLVRSIQPQKPPEASICYVRFNKKNW